jgi:hypothetical protein
MNLFQDETVIVYDIPENNVTKKIIERGIVKKGNLRSIK